jgi:hypothetical protein
MQMLRLIAVEAVAKEKGRPERDDSREAGDRPRRHTRRRRLAGKFGWIQSAIVPTSESGHLATRRVGGKC